MNPGAAPARIALWWLLLAVAFVATAQPAGDPAPLQFSDVAEEVRFHDLAAELRCVMCQNQSLADSNAQIAHDMRREVLVLMRQGQSDAQIKQFLVDRYGEFVLYRPAVQGHTWLLWFGPGLVLLGGGALVWHVVRRRGATTPARAADDNAGSDGNRHGDADDKGQEW